MVQDLYQPAAISTEVASGVRLGLKSEVGNAVKAAVIAGTGPTIAGHGAITRYVTRLSHHLSTC